MAGTGLVLVEEAVVSGVQGIALGLQGLHALLCHLRRLKSTTGLCSGLVDAPCAVVQLLAAHVKQYGQGRDQEAWQHVAPGQDSVDAHHRETQ